MHRIALFYSRQYLWPINVSADPELMNVKTPNCGYRISAKENLEEKYLQFSEGFF